MARDVELLTEIRDLLQVIAEPALEKRDSRIRASLRAVVGTGDKKAKATLLMDGTRSQSEISKESGMDSGNVSRLVKALAAATVIAPDEKRPALLIRIPSTFFETGNTNE
jgi:DNA-binding MarR family transcriptional regulator